MIAFLDACMVIYWIEGQEPFHGRFIATLRQLQTDHVGLQLAVSRLSEMECLVKPLREGHAETAATYRSFFAGPDLLVAELTPDVLRDAAQLRAEHRLSTPDALQAASALSFGGEIVFISNDRRFERLDQLPLLTLQAA